MQNRQNHGTLRFRTKGEKHRSRHISSINLEYDVTLNPNKVIVNLKILRWKSRKPLFEVFKDKIGKVTENNTQFLPRRVRLSKKSFFKKKNYIS